MSWEKIAGWLRLLWDAGKEVQEHGKQIRQLQSDLAETTEALKFLAHQLEYERKLHQKEMENLELRLRLELAEKTRALPPKE